MSERIDILVQNTLDRLAAVELKTHEDVKAFYRDWMDAVWTYQMPSLLFDFYKPDIYVRRENGNDRTGIREIAKEVLAMQAAFPDMKIRVEAMVVTGDEENGYQVWARRYFNGTNLGYSQFGAPTGNTLDGDKCMSLDMLKLEKVNGKWKVTNQYLMYSERMMRVAMGGPYKA